MKRSLISVLFVVLGSFLFEAATIEAQEVAAKRILIHMKTSLAEDDAQICAVPNVAWAAVKAGYNVTILVDASAVTSVTKGFGWFRGLIGSDSTALDRAGLPERERRSLSEQMGVPLDQVPLNYGEYFDFLKKMGIEIYGNRTMMLLYKIDPARVAQVVTPVALERMVRLFAEADRILVY
jgi:predicted peroxiredoxin